MLRTLLPCSEMTSPNLSSSAFLPHHSADTAASGVKGSRSLPQRSLPQDTSYHRSSNATSTRPPPPQRSSSASSFAADVGSETPKHNEVLTTAGRSTLDASTASYMWPRFQPKPDRSSSSAPLLYVDYRRYPRATASAPSTRLEVPALSSSPSPSSPIMSAPASPSYTSLSSVTNASTSSRDRTSRSPKSSHDTGAYVSSDCIYPRYQRSISIEHDIPTTLRKLDINAQGIRNKRRATGSPPWHPYSSESESSCGQSPTINSTSSRYGTMETETEEWMRYAKAADSGASGAVFTCLWPEIKDGRAASCGYSSKKHLVKRHVESKHLQIKPIICEVCGKGFSQRTNYSTHMNTHTGAAPHKCQYPGCEQTFGDPARRHRHMKAVHNHVPSKRRTQSDAGSMQLDVDMSEPEEEDST